MDEFLQIPPLVTAFVSMGAASLVWWWRDRRLTRLRERVTAIQGLSEDILTGRSASAIQQVLNAALPSLLDGATPRLWLADRQSGLLEPADGRGSPMPLSSGSNPVQQSFAASAPVRHDGGAGFLLLLPMRCEGSISGVLELHWPARRRIHLDEEAALAHLANQAAIALRLLDQSILREQVLRSERLGAVGQLLSGVASELEDPVAEVLRIASRLYDADPGHESFRALKDWAASAHQALDRLIAFGRPGETLARPVDLAEVLRKLTHFRERTWRLRQVETRLDLPDSPLLVLGSYGQLEQALLSVILRAEELLPAADDRCLGLSAVRDGERALLVVEFPIVSPPEEWGLTVAHGIAGNHGGSLRLSTEPRGVRCEIDLPLMPLTPPDSPSELDTTRSLTLLLLAPESTESRHLVDLFAARNHRVVPVASDNEALHLCRRLRFDALLAAVPAADPSWIQLHERSNRHVPCFVLLPESDEAATPPPAAAGEVLTLRRPPSSTELARVLIEIENRARRTTS
ncbi:MAG: hypothetical protein M9913_22255 [Bryobacteraceae bacterium]|nr:hypothetical protein [Solibacteraceae bacterium]MCO5353564.1 hypothetical protein [Bryobacteraceae bacterium]